MEDELSVSTGRGRPRAFKSQRELEIKVGSYFESQERKKKPFTLSGLALYLGVTTQTLRNYSDRAMYAKTIAGARQKCEEYAEQQLFLSRNPHGAMFNLKNNYGWKDRTEIEHSGTRVNKIVIERALSDKPQTITIPAVQMHEEIEDKTGAKGKA